MYLYMSVYVTIFRDWMIGFFFFARAPDVVRVVNVCGIYNMNVKG